MEVFLTVVLIALAAVVSVALVVTFKTRESTNRNAREAVRRYELAKSEASFTALRRANSEILNTGYNGAKVPLHPSEKAF